jgi:hypothetical protein
MDCVAVDLSGTIVVQFKVTLTAGMEPEDTCLGIIGDEGVWVCIDDSLDFSSSFGEASGESDVFDTFAIIRNPNPRSSSQSETVEEEQSSALSVSPSSFVAFLSFFLFFPH